jgi:hypothetical protein
MIDWFFIILILLLRRFVSKSMDSTGFSESSVSIEFQYT